MAYRPAAQDSLYGNAKLYDSCTNDIETIFEGKVPATVLLGLSEQNRSQGLPWHLNNEQGHALTFSTTRSGKGTDAIIPALITYNGSMLVIDPKGENAYCTAQRRREIGQRVAIIDPWGAVNKTYGSVSGIMETTTKWNPLAALDPADPNFIDDIALIADALILSGGGEPHWPDSARELVGGLIAAVVERTPGAASLGQMRRLLTSPTDVLIDTIRVIVKARPDSLGARKLARFLVESREISSIRSTAQTQTAVLDSLALMDSLETDASAFNLADLGRGQATAYLVIPPERLRTHGRWLRMIVNLAINAISKQAQAPNPPCLFLLDELGTISPGSGLPMLESTFGLMAGKGIRVWGFFQDLNQLMHDYPQSWRTFIANSSILQVMRINDVETAKYFSEHMGTWTVPTHGGGVAPRPVMHPQELMALTCDDRKHEAIVMMQGGKNFRTNPVPYFKEPRFAGMYRPNPLYPQEAESPLAASPAALARLLRSRITWAAVAAVAVLLIGFNVYWNRVEAARKATELATYCRSFARAISIEPHPECVGLPSAP